MSANDDRHEESTTGQVLPDSHDSVVRQASERCLVSPAWRGVTLTHHGHDIGVVTDVSRSSAPGVAVLHALGGVSRSLEYAVPETAIVCVFGVSSRAVVSDDVEFEPRHLCADGRVILTPRRSHPVVAPFEADWLHVPGAAWVGARVHADDGYLGVVEGTLASARPGIVDHLVVRVQMPFWRKRLSAIPVTRVVAFSPPAKVARVTGTRSELAAMSGAGGVPAEPGDQGRP